MKKVLFVLLCIIIFFVFWNIGSKVGTWKLTDMKYGDMKVKWNDSIGKVIKDKSYGNKESNKYDLYLPATKKDNYSLIVHVHGGGFTSGDKSEAEILTKYFASKGYVTVSINYSLMDDSHSSNLNVMYDELRMALDDIIKTANDNGYNITEMATTGESAGGCLAMLLALRDSESLPVPVKFIMEESGPSNFNPTLWYENASREEQVDFVNNMTGKKFTVDDIDSEEYNKAIDEISPSSYIKEDNIPMLIAYGVNDKIVPPKVKTPLLENLDKYNVKYEYLEFKNSGHGLLGDKDLLKEYHNKMLEYSNKYFENK